MDRSQSNRPSHFALRTEDRCSNQDAGSLESRVTDRSISAIDPVWREEITLEATGLAAAGLLPAPRQSAPVLSVSLARPDDLHLPDRIDTERFYARVTVADVAREEGLNKSHVSRLVRLAFLAPDIITAVLEGRQPVTLTANKLMADTRRPIDWAEQRRALGFS